MKPIKTMVIACMLVLVGCAMVASSAVAQTQGFMQSKEWKKLEPSLQQAWTDAMNSGSENKQFQLFVRCRDPFDPGDRSFLEGAGLNYRMEAGNVARGNAPASAIPQIAELPFVDHISMAR